MIQLNLDDIEAVLDRANDDADRGASRPASAQAVRGIVVY
jgi:hypothetical protein